MDCPMCGTQMKRIIESNGQVYWLCPKCRYTELTKDLPPNPTDDIGDYYED